MAEMKPRPGSMAEAEAKGQKVFRIVTGVIYLALVVVFFTALSKYVNRAPDVLKILGLLFIGGSYWMLWNARNVFSRQIPYLIGALIALILGLCMLAGFNFGDF